MNSSHEQVGDIVRARVFSRSRGPGVLSTSAKVPYTPGARRRVCLYYARRGRLALR